MVRGALTWLGAGFEIGGEGVDEREECHEGCDCKIEVLHGKPNCFK